MADGGPNLTEAVFDIMPEDLADLFHSDLPLAESSASVDRIHMFIDDQKKENTVKSTKRDIKIFTEYLFGQGEFRLIENIPPKELDVLLSNFTSMHERRTVMNTNQDPYSPLSVV